MSSNETLIPIPGRLHSVATEGNVVGANEVVDDTNYDVPKKQSEINADTALEIENIKAKDSNIESLIPSQATSNNQLADKNFVNSSISTATADFKGTYNTLSELQAVTANANDYGFVVTSDIEGNTVYKKYKYTENNGWTFEYDLNNSSFTAEQWATIQSGMTSALTNKLVSLPNNIELQEALATINNTLNSKQDVITDLSTIRNKATTAYQKPVGGIPKTDLAEDVLAFEKGTGTNSAKLKGVDNTVVGDNSVAIGEHNYVEGKDSFAAGKYNNLTSNNNYAFGQYNVVRSSNSTVIGSSNVADNYDHVYAQGQYLRGSGKFAHIEGCGKIDLTISGVANSTTYSIVEDLPAIFIGSYIGFATDNGLLYTTITAIDDINHTITLSKTLNPDSDFVNKTVRLLCSQNLQEAGHVEGKYNLLLLSNEITENPLIGTFIEQYYSTHTDEIVAGHIEGYGNICGGRTSHVEGNFNIAIKAGSHAEGRFTKAIASNAHSEGYNTTASNQQAHAEGRGTQALGRYSHSEGTGTIVSEDSYAGHSEGYTTGVFNTTGGHSEGYGTWCADSTPHVEGYGRFNITLTGAADSLEYSVSPLPEDWWLETYLCDNNSGTAKLIKITAIDKINSTITLENTLGELTNSTRYFIAGSYAKGGCNHVEGYVNRTYASGSHVEGARNIIESTGTNAHVEGSYNRATKPSSHVEGKANIAYGDYSHVEGFCNTAEGSSSHAGGNGSLNVILTGDANATTYKVHIQPEDTWVGKLIKPENPVSNAVVHISAIDAVNKTITVTETLDADNPITAAIYYIALGGAYHDNSFAHGRGVVTGETEQAVFGRYNLVTANALFVVGNGMGYDNPSNAFYIDANGNVYIAGNIVSAQMTKLTNKITELENRIAALEGNS